MCGRPVKPTIHFKDHYAVDYYIEVTGDTERVTIASDEQDKPDLHYSKLISPKTVVVCADCIKKIAE
jgi:hypothetical protein